jgi:RNA polymerase sigma-70 factor (ECF subfamily)
MRKNRGQEGAKPVDPAALVNIRVNVSALLDRDEAAFLSLVSQYQPSMLRVCEIFVNDPAVAEEVVQDTWLDMLRGLEHFEGRSSLKTWLFTILTNKAKTRSKRESRSIPFSAFEALGPVEGELSVNPERFLPAGCRWAGHWVEMPHPWERAIEEQVLSDELLDTIRAVIQLLPESQRLVFSMRDIDGWSSGEVCNVMGFSETHQRVLLHRARSKVRRALEQYFDQKVGSA